MTTSQRYVAICADEMKPIVSAELLRLGASEITDGYRAVHFSADLRTAYGIHLRLSSASRILQHIISFPANDLRLIGQRLARARFHEIFAPKAGYLVEAIAGDRGPGAPTSNDLSKTVRLAVEEVFERKGLEKPRVDLAEPKVVLVAYMHGGRFSLSIDTSGKSLHKRGYRLEAHPAPLKEHLAAGILQMIGYDGSQTLVEPMCGSGTIAIEAAFIALGKAPLIHRRKGDFGFEWLESFDRQLWKEVQDEARADRLLELPKPIYAADIRQDYVESAQRNALRARVEKHIIFATRSFHDWEAPDTVGMLVMNLPYGTRLEQDRTDWHAFYGDIGNTLKRRFKGWTAGILVAADSDYKFIGLKPKRKISLMNGAIPCKFLIFNLY